MTVSEWCLIKLLPYILVEKYIDILALELASQGTSTVPVVSAHCRSLWGISGLRSIFSMQRGLSLPVVIT